MKTRAPGGSNELKITPSSARSYEVPKVEGSSSSYGGKPSMKSRHSRPISGLSYSSAKALEYKGT